MFFLDKLTRTDVKILYLSKEHLGKCKDNTFIEYS